MNHGSLFSGIGGFDYAAHMMGWNNVFHCEWNKDCQKILKYHFPNAITYEDIRNTDFSVHRGTIEVLSGGFPCQPFSVAGKRKGSEDERHLWPEMCRAIREIAPRYVVGENVYGMLNWNGGMVFDQVCADLENEGYEITPLVLPAVGINAPHKRERLFIVAHAKQSGHCTNGRTDSEKNSIPQEYRQTICTGQSDRTNTRNAADTESRGYRGIQDQGKTPRPRKGNTSFGSIRGVPHDAADTDIHGLERGIFSGSNGKQGWHRPVSVAPEHLSSPEYALSGYRWENFPTQSPVCGRNDGFSTLLDNITFSKWRNQSLKQYGNAIVPQLAFMIFKAIQMMEEKEKAGV
jgi:DNA (cytosine-5)-methyltransferase 1